VRILLLELGDRVLPTFHPSLSAYAKHQLAGLGVVVQLGAAVDLVDDNGVVLRDGTRIDAATVVWTAGVRTADLAAAIGVPHTKRGRIEVDDRLRVVGRDDVYAIGDDAAVHDPKLGELPMVSPPAMQAGRYVADAIVGKARKPFRYLDKGNLATIGRRSAVAEIHRLRFKGFLGWLVWLVVHLYYLIGFENRLLVMLRWSWYYVRLERPVRAIIRADDDGTAGL
jgi:NADH dehydrogenase